MTCLRASLLSHSLFSAVNAIQRANEPALGGCVTETPPYVYDDDYCMLVRQDTCLVPRSSALLTTRC